MSSRLDIAVIIVTANKLAADCLPSLKRAMDATPLNVGLVLVDNASTSFDAYEAATRHIPEATVILRERNYGFGHSANRGAREVEAEFYFFLNPDTVLTDPHLLDTLHRFMREHPHAGIVAPKVTYPDGTSQETVRRFPAWHMPLLQRTSLFHRLFPGWSKRETDRFLLRDAALDVPRLIDWAQGSALFVDGRLFHRLGGFDERFFMYFEDIDLCRRAWKAERPVYFHPGTQMVHEHGKGSAAVKGTVRSILLNPLARAHIRSWLSYVWKWKGTRL